MNLEYLKSQTAVDHEAVEGALPLMGPELTRTQYANVLIRLFTFIRTWEHWADHHAPAHLLPLMEHRRRSRLIRQDLDHMGRDVPHVEKAPHFPDSPSETQFLGALYVIEGSTLGGRIIARHLEQKLNLEPGKGNSYFTGYGEDTGAMWREVKSFLGQVPDNKADEVVAAAKATFLLFGNWMTGQHSSSN